MGNQVERETYGSGGAQATSANDTAALNTALPPPNLDEQNNVSYTDADLLMEAIARQDGRIDMSTVPRMPFFGWPYTRSLLFGLCATETDILAATQHPQWVPERELAFYHRLPHPFPVWVNYRGFGGAVATHFQVVYASSRPIVYLCVQAVRPFGAQEFNGYRDGNTYRVFSEWCVRLPAIVASILEGNVTLLFARGVATGVDIGTFVTAKGTCFDNTLRVAKAVLLRDYPNQATVLVGFVPQAVLCDGGQ